MTDHQFFRTLRKAEEAAWSEGYDAGFRDARNPEYLAQDALKMAQSSGITVEEALLKLTGGLHGTQ